MKKRFKHILKVFFVLIIIFLASFIYNYISGNRAPFIGQTIAFFRSKFDNFKVVDIDEVVVNLNEITYKELPKKIQNILIDYREDMNRPISKKKFNYSIPFINLTSYDVDYESSNFIYSNYFLFYTYGADYKAILFNKIYYINITDFGLPIFYDNKMYIFSRNNELGTNFNDLNAKYYAINIEYLLN